MPIKVIMPKYQQRQAEVLPRIGKIKKGDVKTSTWGADLCEELRIDPEPQYARVVKELYPTLRITEEMAIVASDEPLSIAINTFDAAERLNRVCNGESIVLERGATLRLDPVNKPCQKNELGICPLCSGKNKGELVPVKPMGKLNIILQTIPYGYFELMSTSEVDHGTMAEFVFTLEKIKSDLMLPSIMSIPFTIRRREDASFMGRYFDQKSQEWKQSKRATWFLDFKVADRIMTQYTANLFMGGNGVAELQSPERPQIEAPKKELPAKNANGTNGKGIAVINDVEKLLEYVNSHVSEEYQMTHLFNTCKRIIPNFKSFFNYTPDDFMNVAKQVIKHANGKVETDFEVSDAEIEAAIEKTETDTSFGEAYAKNK